MAKKAALKRVSVPVPQNLAEANESLRKVGEYERSLQELQQEIDEKIAEIGKEYASRIEEQTQGLNAEMEALHSFAESHRKEILPNGSKTVQLVSGTISWRMTPLAVSVKGEDNVLAFIRKQRKLKRFLRITVALNRQAMLAEPTTARTIPGVTISQHEEFYAKPKGATAEITVDNKGKATIIPPESEKKGKKKKAA